MKDEEACSTPNWHRWLAITSILLFLVILFFSSLKFKVKEKEMIHDLALQSTHDHQNLSLDKGCRGQLAFRLESGGREEAVRIYDQIQKEELLQKWHLKVCEKQAKKI